MAVTMSRIAENETTRVVAEMLTENTGRHFLDSGGAYGRNWERNQGQTVESFAAQPASYFTGLRWNELTVEHNVFHWLTEACTYNGPMDRVFQRWAELPGQEDKCWLELMDEYVEKLGKRREIGGIYGDASGPVTVNTYNGEDLLSQTLQYVYWEDGDGGHVILQVHGGADVRGGYTRPRIFDADVDGNGGVGIFDNARAGMGCMGDPRWAQGDPTLEGIPTRESVREQYHAWYSDDGSHWYGANYEQNLDSGEYQSPDVQPLPDELSEPTPDMLNGQTVWTDGERAFCPECGAELQPSFY
jgi:hypothetical protein